MIFALFISQRSFIVCAPLMFGPMLQATSFLPFCFIFALRQPHSSPAWIAVILASGRYFCRAFSTLVANSLCSGSQGIELAPNEL